MKKRSIDKVKELYDNGFRCIRYEDGNDGQFIAYFKNFKDEKIDSLTCEDLEEIDEIKSYIDKY